MVDRYNKLGDRMYTKIFVGGLAWRTRSRSLSHYFEQFGEILEAVVIYDKYTGKSKGFGFVTFREEESARKACEIPHPVIDGRRANCNLAFLGATKHHPPPATYLVQVAKLKPGPHNKGYPFSPGKYERESATANSIGSLVGPITLSKEISQYPAHSQEYYYPMSYFNVQTGGQTIPEPVYLNYYYPVHHDEQQGSSSGSQYPKFVPVTVLPEQWPVLPMLAPPPTIELPPMAAAEASKAGSRVVIAPNALPTNSLVRHTRPQVEVEEEENEDPNLRILTVTEDRSNDLLTD